MAGLSRLPSVLISGYFFTIESYAEGKITKLIKRLVVPYVIFISLYLMGLIFIKRFGIETSNNPPRDFSHFINTILFKPYGGYWFLHSLIIIQLASIVSAFFVNSLQILLTLPFVRFKRKCICYSILM